MVGRRQTFFNSLQKPCLTFNFKRAERGYCTGLNSLQSFQMFHLIMVNVKGVACLFYFYLFVIRLLSNMLWLKL